MEVLYTLDKALPAIGSGSGGKVRAALLDVQVVCRPLCHYCTCRHSKMHMWLSALSWSASQLSVGEASCSSCEVSYGLLSLIVLAWATCRPVQMDEASFEPGTLTGELLILATAANQLFQSTQYMSPDAQVCSSLLHKIIAWCCGRLDKWLSYTSHDRLTTGSDSPCTDGSLDHCISLHNAHHLPTKTTRQALCSLLCMWVTAGILDVCTVPSVEPRPRSSTGTGQRLHVISGSVRRGSGPDRHTQQQHCCRPGQAAGTQPYAGGPTG